jgi:CheY-like chemotaxis protein
MRPLKTALIVDDSAPIRGMLRMLLDHAGLRVIEARDGAEALSLLDDLDWQVDVVASDIQMPVMDGLAFARVMMTATPSRVTRPALLLHSSESECYAEQARALGVPLVPKSNVHALVAAIVGMVRAPTELTASQPLTTSPTAQSRSSQA